MMITKKAISRRHVLRGAGAALALPLLDAMIPALTVTARTAARPVTRLGFIYVPHGAPARTWTPPGEGALGELSPALTPLAKFKDQMTVLTNIELHEAQGPGGNHALSNSTFLSAKRGKRTDGTDYQLATTVDQLAAKAIGQDTQIPSLELALDLNYLVGTCDNGYNCVYMNSLAWSSATTPLPSEANPRVVFERLFGDGVTSAERLSEARRNRSILDWVNGEMNRLQRQLGAGDRARMGEYLDTIREVERRIQRAESANATEVLPRDLARPANAPASWEDHAKLMFDLQTLALRADITRVITFQLAQETSTRTFPDIGVPDAWHPTSHHQENPEKLAKLAKINSYCCGLVAYYLEKLRATPDGDGSLLDHSMILYGSGMGDSDKHDHRNVPMVLLGGGSGTLRGGRHIKYKELTPMANIHLNLLDRIGVRLDAFGDSSGRLPELDMPASL